MTVHPAFPISVADATPLAVRVADPLSLSDELAKAWDRLADEASEPNPFAERWCLQPALHLLDSERRARLEEAPDLIGPFKRAAYLQVVEAFRRFAKA